MEVVLLLCFTLILIFFLKSLFKSKKLTNQPPSPRGLPVIGNLHQLGRHLHRSLRSLSIHHGPLMLLQFGRVPVLVVTSVDGAEEVMKTHDREFANRPKTKIIDKLFKGGREVAFAPYGEYWREMKSVYVLHLLGNKMVRLFHTVREEEINLMIEKIEEASSSSSPINLSKCFVTLTNDVTCRVALGRKYGGETDFMNLMRKFGEVLVEFPLGEYIPSLSWIDRLRGLDATAEYVGNKFDDLMEIVVQEHIEGDDQEKLDFVNVLLSIQREMTAGFEINRSDVKAMILDMFLAGTETTYTLLEWAMTELIMHPECMQKLQDEIRTIQRQKPYVSEEEVENMKYLKAVIREALRLHPPLPLLVFRKPSQDVQLKGYDIAAGTHVIINAWAIQRDSTLWGSDAEEFRPERHLDSSLDFRGQNFKFIPFGAGRRLCPGIGFALTLAELALANVVNRFDWRVEIGPQGDQSFVAEATGLAVPRKFPLIVFPSSAYSAL